MSMIISRDSSSRAATVLWVLAATSLSACSAEEPDDPQVELTTAALTNEHYMRLQVVTSQGSPVPCATVITPNRQVYTADASGLIAFHEPGLHQKKAVRFYGIRYVTEAGDRPSSFPGEPAAAFIEVSDFKNPMRVDVRSDANAVGFITWPWPQLPPDDCGSGDYNFRLLSTFGGRVPGRAERTRILVRDGMTGAPLPGVRIRARARNQGDPEFFQVPDFHTDNNGVVAFFHPNVMNRHVDFEVVSHGYRLAHQSDHIERRRATMGGTIEFVMDRLPGQIANREFRVTGHGRYRETELLQEPRPAFAPNINAMVMGQDSAKTAAFGGRVFWIWGDTHATSFSNFRGAAATSLLPGRGPQAQNDIHLEYILDPYIRVREQMPESRYRPHGLWGPHGDVPRLAWMDGLISVIDGPYEVLIGTYQQTTLPPFGAWEWGVSHYDFAERNFEPMDEKFGVAYSARDVGETSDQINECVRLGGRWVRRPADSKGVVPPPLCMFMPERPKGHPHRVEHADGDYVYFQNDVRVAANRLDMENRDSYRTFTPVVGQDPDVVEWDDNGRAAWKWRDGPAPSTKSVAGFGGKHQDIREHAQAYDRKECFSLGDACKITTHRATDTAYNPYRKRYIRLLNPANGRENVRFENGEIWYQEADTPMGPWVYARKIATHLRVHGSDGRMILPDYSLYNPRLHSYYNQQGGRKVFFEGTLTQYTRPQGASPYEIGYHTYNQMMYSLDLGEAELSLPVAIYDLQQGGTPGDFTTHEGLPNNYDNRPAPFMAHDRATPGMLPVSRVNGRLIAGDASAPIFHVLPSWTPPSDELQPLYEYRDTGSGNGFAFVYTTATSWNMQGPLRVVGQVWKNPVHVSMPVTDYLPTATQYARYGHWYVMDNRNDQLLRSRAGETRADAVSSVSADQDTHFRITSSSRSATIMRHGDKVRVTDSHGRWLRHTSSYASFGTDWSDTEWYVHDVGGRPGKIDRARRIALVAIDNGKRLKSKSGGAAIRIYGGTGNSSKWKLDLPPTPY